MKRIISSRVRAISQRWILTAAVLSMVAPAPKAFAQETGCGEPWPIRRAMFMYSGSAMPRETLDQIADRFEFVVEGYRPDIQYMLDKRSTLKFAAMYNSLTDNYIDRDEHEWLMNNASRHGLTGEDSYVHFWEDTVVSLEGQNVTIPGWNPNRSVGDPPASATNRADARVPVYFSNLRRRLVNFESKAHRDLHRDYNVMRFNQPMAGGYHPGGVFFDNSMNHPLTVRIVSGGRVAEHPTKAVMNSDEFMDWYWMQGARLFLNEMRVYLNNNRDMFGGRQIYVIPNTANAPWIGRSDWEQSYVDLPAGHILALEFQYSPTRNHGRDLPGVIYNKHTMALANDVSLFETGYLFTGQSDLVGSFTEAEAVMNNIAGHWVQRADDAASNATTYLTGVNVWDPNGNPERWGLNLSGAFDVDLGRPVGPPFVIREGTDGKGNPYKIFGRAFACGFAVVRHRDPWDGDLDESTAVQFDLPGEYAPVNLDGQFLRPVTTWSLRNGAGQVFVADGSGPNLVPPAAPENLREGTE